MIVNWLLTLLTAGLYYPWARAKRLRYIYGQTALNDERFHFSGTGREMFYGFIKLILFYIVFMGISYLIRITTDSPIIFLLFFYISLFSIIPFAIHGSFRYRMSRTSYRGIRFGYRGNRNELVINFFKWVFFSIITFGIYGFWMQMNIRNYTHSNIRYGDVEFSSYYRGGEWFSLHVKGYLLTFLTFGIYIFWYQRDIFDYYVNNIKLIKEDQEIECYSTAEGDKFLILLVGNFLITVFTLGFGKAWADIRTQRFICNNIKMDGNINLDEISQTEEEYKNAFGEDAIDFFEIDLA